MSMLCGHLCDNVVQYFFSGWQWNNDTVICIICVCVSAFVPNRSDRLEHTHVRTRALGRFKHTRYSSLDDKVKLFYTDSSRGIKGIADDRCLYV